MTIQVGIYVFDEVEVLDFAGPYEVFTTAARVHARSHPGDAPLFRVFTVGARKATVRARAGLKIDPDFDFDDHPPIDCLIIPGGVVTAESDKAPVMRWIDSRAEAARITASVCTGVFLLARTGRLNGRNVTTHWEDAQDLHAMYPQLHVKTGVRWVDEGSLVTSAGISAGIDMSLHLVERLEGRALAERTALQLEFDWTENAT